MFLLCTACLVGLGTLRNHAALLLALLLARWRLLTACPRICPTARHSQKQIHLWSKLSVYKLSVSPTLNWRLALAHRSKALRNSLNFSGSRRDFSLSGLLPYRLDTEPGQGSGKDIRVACMAGFNRAFLSGQDRVQDTRCQVPFGAPTRRHTFAWCHDAQPSDRR